MPHDTKTPEDPSKEAELQNVMEQIKALSGGVEEKTPTLGPVPAQAPDPPPAAPPTPAMLQKEAEALKAIATLKRAKAKAFTIHDVVQITSRESSRYGVLFQVGDIESNEVHGYSIREHAGREFVTAKLGEVAFVGESKVRLKTTCSPKWMADHREGA